MTRLTLPPLPTIESPRGASRGREHLAAGVAARETATPHDAPGALTPLMRQYDRIKRAHQDAVLIFRLGDFYEMFDADAEVGAAALGLALTSRNNGKAKRVPLAGFPAKAAETYIGRLLAAGYKVAVCEQMEDPRTARGLVKREVVEVVTPGALLNERYLAPSSQNFLAALSCTGERVGIALADISTGEFWLLQVPLDEAAAELERHSPAEVLMPASWCDDAPAARARDDRAAGARLRGALQGARSAKVPVTARGDDLFDSSGARRRLLEHLGVVTLDGFGVPETSPAVAAAGAAIAYLAEVQPQGVKSLVSLRWLRCDDFLLLDETTLRNLEVFRTLGGAEGDGTLVRALDATLTRQGARLLRTWLLQPLRDGQAIRRRQDAVAHLIQQAVPRATLRAHLRRLPDVPRIAGRCVAGRASPRDLGALRGGLVLLPHLLAGLEPPDAASPGVLPPAALPPALQDVAAELGGFGDLARELDRALPDELPAALGDGAAIRAGWNEQLDALREGKTEGLGWIAALQARERARTGIASLKVGYNRVFGYYIEVTRSNVAQVPADYQRKQTIANGERFVTPELKEVEERVLGAEEKIAGLEAQLFAELQARVAARAAALQRMGAALAALDVLASFAELAAERGYCRPQVVEDDVLDIRGGRHPVVEVQAGLGGFIPNDACLDDQRRVMILTGPNMAGKSTYLRQVGLIALLAHVGSWVPAESARLGVMDRIFTRVGASDDLARGRSTFLVEMVETANILRSASGSSLVLLDEIGRGTATFDGLSLAWAVTEWLHAAPAGLPRTIFATHYHELTELAAILPRVFNAHVQVREWEDEIVFLRKVADGKSDRSYGIQVAKLAGMPEEVVARAREILANLEAGEFSLQGLPRRSRGRSAPAADPPLQISIFEAVRDPVRDELSALDIEGLTPLAALNVLAEWKRKYG